MFLETQDSAIHYLTQVDESLWGVESTMNSIMGVASDLTGACEACDSEQVLTIYAHDFLFALFS